MPLTANSNVVPLWQHNLGQGHRVQTQTTEPHNNSVESDQHLSKPTEFDEKLNKNLTKATVISELESTQCPVTFFQEYLSLLLSVHTLKSFYPQPGSVSVTCIWFHTESSDRIRASQEKYQRLIGIRVFGRKSSNTVTLVTHSRSI